MAAAFRACLLSGGSSRRMGRDKALLPHPAGGTWLERSLDLLLGLGQPVTLLSRHPNHRLLARELAARHWPEATLTTIVEPPPWEGPLRALARLMALHAGQRLLLCPVDMPWLDSPSLQGLVAVAQQTGGQRFSGSEAPIHLAHDGDRLQPLLGFYPATAARQQRLEAHLNAGGRRLQSWLAGETWQPVPLAAGPLRNVNRPEDLTPHI